MYSREAVKRFKLCSLSLRFIRPVLVMLLAFLVAAVLFPIGSSAATLELSGPLGEADGGYRPWGDHLLVSEYMEQYLGKNYIFCGRDCPGSTVEEGHFTLKANGTTLTKFRLEDVKISFFLESEVPDMLYKMKITAVYEGNHTDVLLDHTWSSYLYTDGKYSLSGHFDSDVSRDNIKELQFEWLMTGSAVDLNFESITITEMNNPPVAADDAYTVDEDDVLSGTNVLTNDTDIDDDLLTAILVDDVHTARSAYKRTVVQVYAGCEFHGTDSRHNTSDTRRTMARRIRTSRPSRLPSTL